MHATTVISLFKIYNDVGIVSMMKTSRISWLGHLYIEKEVDPNLRVILTRIG
jgi:hypothetical protein